MRIIFVGLHNKPGMKPLDSKTKSGKLIDRVIGGLLVNDVLKTNLFNVDKLPSTDKELKALAQDWFERIEPISTDIVIVLGGMTQRYFKNLPKWIAWIKAPHPASQWSHDDMDYYIASIVERVNKRFAISSAI